MIEISTAVDSLERTGENPYDRLPSDVEANPEDYGDPYADMLTVLRGIAVDIQRLANTSERERNTPGFSEAPISNANFPATVAYRPVYLIFTNDTAAANITLRYGSSVQVVIPCSTADIRVIPWTRMIQRGTDVTITASVGTVVGWFVGYPE